VTPPGVEPATGPNSDPTPGPQVTGLDPDYPIRTGRLLLRPWRIDDLDTYHRLWGDPEVVRFLYDRPLSRTEARAKLASLRTTVSEPGQWLNVAVEVTATGEVAGDVGLGLVSDVHRLADIGYTFLPGHRGNGYATEAAAAMIDLAVTVLGCHRVAGHLDARNTASAALLERLGMRHEAHLVENERVKGEWTDESIYAVLATEWAARRADG
jgi:RimJ/RimL family protein N-acetyltransferase